MAGITKLLNRLDGDGRLSFGNYKRLSQFLGQQHIPKKDIWEIFVKEGGESANDDTIRSASFPPHPTPNLPITSRPPPSFHAIRSQLFRFLIRSLSHLFLSASTNSVQGF
jgi:hypothetical protein